MRLARRIPISEEYHRPSGSTQPDPHNKKPPPPSRPTKGPGFPLSRIAIRRPRRPEMGAYGDAALPANALQANVRVAQKTLHILPIVHAHAAVIQDVFVFEPHLFNCIRD